MNRPGVPSIAKWIGHASPTVTAGVYGKLSLLDAEGSLVPVGFLSDGRRDSAAAKEQWESLARFLKEPYHFAEEEAQQGLGERPTKQMRRELLERARSASGSAETAVVGHLQRQMEMLVALKQRLDADGGAAAAVAKEKRPPGGEARPGGAQQTHE